MERDNLKAAKKKKAWAATKTAVGAYAKNPCRATEIEVATALHKVRTLSKATTPEGRQGSAGKKASK